MNSDDYTDMFDWLDTNHHEELIEYVCENYADEIIKWFDLQTLFIPNYANDKLKQILDKELESK